MDRDAFKFAFSMKMEDTHPNLDASEESWRNQLLSCATEILGDSNNQETPTDPNGMLPFEFAAMPIKEGGRQENSETFELEGTAELAEQRSVESIMRIMDLSQDQISNYKPLPLPKLKRSGAGIVNKFRSDEIFPSLLTKAIKTKEKDDIDDVLLHMNNGSYTFLPLEPGGGQSIQELRNKLKDLKVEASAQKFKMTKSEIRKRAAWAWYRTSLLYERSASQVQANGVSHSQLNFQMLGRGLETTLFLTVKTLRLRAERARAQAMELDSAILEGSPMSPSWAQGVLEGSDSYYKKIAQNHDAFNRAKVAKVYKTHAFTCICEVISVYLDDTGYVSERAAGRSQSWIGKDGYVPMAQSFAGAGGIVQLWAKAAEWSAHPETRIHRAKQFRTWWLRAAMARGHAQWLLDELRHSPTLERRPIAEWRLLPPPPISYYDNDCVVTSRLIAVFHQWEWPGYVDDIYHSRYNSFQVYFREEDHVANGRPLYGFAPGAPDFVFTDRLLTGWSTDLLGIWPMENTILKVETGYHDLYLRKGLADFLPDDTTQYEMALAVCVDHIVLEWQQDFYIENFPIPEPWQDLNRAFETMISQVSALYRERCWLTIAECSELDFNGKVSKAIYNYLKSMPSSWELYATMRESSPYYMWMLRIEYELRAIVGPWSDVELYLNSPISRQTPKVGICPLGSERRRDIFILAHQGVDSMQDRTSSVWAKLDLNMRIFRAIDRIRDMILSNDDLEPDYLEFAACFRDFLLSNDVERLPKIKLGISYSRQEMPWEFRRKQLSNPNCSCPQEDPFEFLKENKSSSTLCDCGSARSERQYITRMTARQSDSAQAVSERAMLQTFFARTDDLGLPKFVFKADTQERKAENSTMKLSGSISTFEFRSNAAPHARETLDMMNSGRLLLPNERAKKVLKPVSRGTASKITPETFDGTRMTIRPLGQDACSSASDQNKQQASASNIKNPASIAVSPQPKIKAKTAENYMGFKKGFMLSKPKSDKGKSSKDGSTATNGKHEVAGGEFRFTGLPEDYQQQLDYARAVANRKAPGADS